MIKAILFDLWDTLTYNKESSRIVERYCMLLHITNKEFYSYRKLWNKKMWSTPYFFSYVARNTPLYRRASAIEIEKASRLWHSIGMTSKLFSDVKPTLRKLRSKEYKIGLVSNSTPVSVSIIQKLDMKPYFDVMILSCKEGVMKPDHHIYKLALHRLKVKGKECLFVGDNKECDYDSPKKLGMKALVIARYGKKGRFNKGRADICKLNEIYQHL